MKRADVRRSGLVLFLLVGIIVGAAIGACSASGGKAAGGPSGSGSTTGSGSTSYGGTSVGGAVGSGGTVSFNTGGTSGNDASTSGGTGGGSSNASGSCPQPIDRCSATDVAKFANPTSGPKLLYPYDGTVFPRGLNSPTFQWDSTSSTDAVMIQLKSGSWSYRECFGAQSAANIKVPQDAWDAQSVCAGGQADPVTATITIVSGGQVYSVSIQIYFAFATLKGAIYYNTYQTTLASSGAGAVMKITPGAATNPTVFLSVNGVYPTGPCVSCHSLSSNGIVMTANNHTYPGGPYLSESFDVSGGSPVLKFNNLPEAGFSGIYPDGSVLMTNGPASASTGLLFPVASYQPVALIGPATSRLLDTSTGQVITAPGWDVQHANMPTFSPDGKHMVYNDQDVSTAHTLWMVDFDITTKTFSNKHQIFSDSTRFPGWPFFTPDSKQVIFVLGTADNFTSQTPNPDTFLPFTAVANSHLMMVDVATGQATPLDLANGYKNGASYLPNNDNDLEFYSTISPVAAGGYFWAFFTSRRSYGNLYNKGKDDYTQKKIWGTAITIGAPAGTDPSHPAFYLEGQELTTGNMRAFAALNPCKEDGSSCTSGSDCCAGYCNGIDATTGIGICGPLPPTSTCARSGDKCAQDSDCCTGTDNGASGAPLYCINSYCSEIVR